MDSLKKRIASWEIRYGQTSFNGSDYPLAKKLFADYLGTTFNVDTFKGRFPNKHFIDDGTRLRLACAPFFSKLKEGDVIYLQPWDHNTIRITQAEPQTQATPEVSTVQVLNTQYAPEQILQMVYGLVSENKSLREQNQELIQYKDRLDKFERLDYIFEDEAFLEDWLERNIHKALPNLEVIDRQPVVTWTLSFMRNRPDFFCMDRTTHELVIVENKVRGRHKRIETQFLTYKAWVKAHLVEINEKYKEKGMVATENFKFVVITDTVDERLVAICEDNGIALVLIDGGVVFEEIVPYYPR